MSGAGGDGGEDSEGDGRSNLENTQDHQSWKSADPEWPVEEVVTQLQNPWFDAGYDRVRQPDGTTGDYYWIEYFDAVAVVTHDRTAEELVMVEQYRPRFRRRFVGCPAGGVEDGEDPETAARRELREETGYRADRIDRLGSYHPSGFDRMTRHVFYATDLTAGDTDRDDGEEITVVRRDPETAVETALSNTSTGWTVTPLLWAREADLL